MKAGIQLENKHMAAFFFMLCIIFFGLFVWNMYTMNAIMMFFCLVLSVSFKTWSIQREVNEQIDKVILKRL